MHGTVMQVALVLVRHRRDTHHSLRVERARERASEHTFCVDEFKGRILVHLSPSLPLPIALPPPLLLARSSLSLVIVDFVCYRNDRCRDRETGGNVPPNTKFIVGFLVRIPAKVEAR